VLQSIYEPGAIRVWHPSPEVQHPPNADVVRYEIEVAYVCFYHCTVISCLFIKRLPAPHEDIPLRILVSLSPDYPASHPPQLQLLSRYIGSFSIDSSLFGSILRTYIAHLDGGVEFSPDVVCVFDGVQSVLDRCQEWYEHKLSEATAGELAREEERGQNELSEDVKVREVAKAPPEPVGMPEGVEMFVAEPILDRKSSFIGRACRISDPAQVWLLYGDLVARAHESHPGSNHPGSPHV
jgi:hypothetical protein